MNNKINSKNAQEGMVVCLDNYPYKPFEITMVKDWGIRLSPVEKNGTTARFGRTFEPKDFDECGYIMFLPGGSN